MKLIKNCFLGLMAWMLLSGSNSVEAGVKTHLAKGVFRGVLCIFSVPVTLASSGFVVLVVSKIIKLEDNVYSENATLGALIGFGIPFIVGVNSLNDNLRLSRKHFKKAIEMYKQNNEKSR